MKYLLLRKLQCRIKERRTVHHTVLSFVSVIASAIFPNCLHDLVCFANSFGSDSGSRSMESIFLAVYLLLMVFESKSDRVTKLFRISAAGKVSSWIVVHVDRMEKGMDHSQVETSGATYWAQKDRGLKRGKTIDSERKGTIWRTSRADSEKNGLWSETRLVGSTYPITVFDCILTLRNVEFAEEKYSDLIQFLLSVFPRNRLPDA